MNRIINNNFLKHWNAIIRDKSNSSGKPLDDEALWEEFGIKSAPKFPESCWFDIPDSWANEVREMITEINTKFGKKVRYVQIKEKFCELTVYVDCPQNMINSIVEIVINTQEKLKKRGVHP